MGNGDIENEYRMILEGIKNNVNKDMSETYNNAKVELDGLISKTSREIELNIRRRLGIVYSETCKYYEALIEFETVLDLHNRGYRFKYIEYDVEKTDETIFDDLCLAWTHHDLGIIYTVMKEYSAAEKHFNKAIYYVKAVKDTSTEAWFLNDLGWMYHEKGKYKKARAQYDEVLKLDIKDEPLKSYYKAYPYFYSGLAYYRENREGWRETIIENFRKSKSLMENHKNNLDGILFIANIETNLGRLCLDENRLDEAQEKLKSAIDIYSDKQDDIMERYTPRKMAVVSENIANVHHILGRLYFEKGLTQKAIEEFETTKNESKSKNVMAKYLNNMGCIRFKQGELDEAVENFSSAIEKDSSLKGALDNLKLASKSTKRSAGFCDFWFGNDGKFNQDNIIKSLLACGLIFLIIANIAIIMIPDSDLMSSWGYVNETTSEKTYQNNNVSNGTTKTTNKISPNFEYNLVLIGLSLLMLMLPWTKSFEAMNIKMEFNENPAILTGGAGNSPASPEMET